MPLEEGETFFFAPRPLKNLIQVDELESLSPIMTSHVRRGRGGRGDIGAVGEGVLVVMSVMSHEPPQSE